MIRSKGYFLRDTKTDLRRIFEKKYAEKHFCERKFPNQGTYMGHEIAQRPEQCATTAKTSEWKRAGPKPCLLYTSVGGVFHPVGAVGAVHIDFVGLFHGKVSFQMHRLLFFRLSTCSTVSVHRIAPFPEKSTAFPPVLPIGGKEFPNGAKPRPNGPCSPLVGVIE